jgi:hypothetical protein
VKERFFRSRQPRCGDRDDALDRGYITGATRRPCFSSSRLTRSRVSSSWCHPEGVEDHRQILPPKRQMCHFPNLFLGAGGAIRTHPEKHGRRLLWKACAMPKLTGQFD